MIHVKRNIPFTSLPLINYRVSVYSSDDDISGNHKKLSRDAAAIKVFL